jgi:23S rRNA (uracil1939-C5)-methyltransferase
MVQPGDVFTAQATDLNADGFGVVRHPSGLVAFVAGLWPGETGQCRVHAVQQNYALASCEAHETQHSARGEAFCPHHGHGETHCTGCIWQGIDYAAQVAAKQSRLRSLLPASAATLREIWPAPDQRGYRNRAQLKTDGTRLGYVNRFTHGLVPIETCPILTAKNARTLAQLQKSLPRRDWQRETLTTLDIDHGVSAQTVSVNQRRPFQQGNDAQNKKMRRWLAAHIAQLRRPHIVELFCGSGNLTDVMAPAAAKITAVEAVGEAVAALREKKLPRVTAVIADLAKPTALVTCLRQIQPHPTCLVLDPPRQGFALLPDCLALLPSVQHVFYISCDADSFARDVDHLSQAGYAAAEIQPLDLFPHTPHIEILAHFRRNAGSTVAAAEKP